MLTAIAAAFILSSAVPSSAAPADSKKIRAVIEKTVNSVLDVLKEKGLDKDVRRKRVLDVVDPVFDFRLMGRLTLLRGHWAKLDESQKVEFMDLFIQTIKDSYYEKIDLFTDETVEFDDPVPGEKGKYQMLTRVNSKGQRYGILYKLYRTGSEWKVYDVEVEGVSLIQSYGSQYDQFLQKGTVPGLLARMRQKALGTPADLKAATKKPAGKNP